MKLNEKFQKYCNDLHITNDRNGFINEHHFYTREYLDVTHLMNNIIPNRLYGRHILAYKQNRRPLNT